MQESRLAGPATANVNNVFNRAPPVSPTGPLYYDAIGTYLAARDRKA
jgi:hypothetical protein